MKEDVAKLLDKVMSSVPIVVKIDMGDGAKYYAISKSEYEDFISSDMALNRELINVRRVKKLYGYLYRDKKGTLIKYSHAKKVVENQILRKSIFYTLENDISLQTSFIKKIEKISDESMPLNDRYAAEEILADILERMYDEMFT